MSVDIYVVAQREVSKDDLLRVELYHQLVQLGHKPPKKLCEEIEKLFGQDAEDLFEDEETPVTEHGLIEIPIDGKGDAKYSDGMVIKLDDLPPNTKALRIFME